MRIWLINISIQDSTGSAAVNIDWPTDRPIWSQNFDDEARSLGPIVAIKLKNEFFGGEGEDGHFPALRGVPSIDAFDQISLGETLEVVLSIL